MHGLRSFRALRQLQQRLRIFVWNRFWGMNVHPSARISMSARLDKTNPRGIHIHEHVCVTFGVAILSHDASRSLYADTVIEADCFIGAHSILLPGVRIGRGSVVAAGSVVTRDVPSGSIVAGNPARVIRSGLETGPYGVIRNQADQPGPAGGAG